MCEFLGAVLHGLLFFGFGLVLTALVVTVFAYKSACAVARTMSPA